MTEEQFKALKVGDLVERVPDVRYAIRFRAQVKIVETTRIQFLITDVIENPLSRSDLAVGKIWSSTMPFADCYHLLDQAPIAFPTSLAEPEKHIAGISPEVINFDAGRELVM